MNKEEILNLLKTDLKRFNELRQADQERWDLRGVDLAGTNLQGAELRRMDLNGASFQKANLSEAQFGGSTLDGADFRGADLSGANFHHARMQGADFRGAKITANTPMGRFCVNIASFDRVRWDRGLLVEVLEILNKNSDWHIKYEIIPKSPPRREASPDSSCRRGESSPHRLPERGHMSGSLEAAGCRFLLSCMVSCNRTGILSV